MRNAPFVALAGCAGVSLLFAAYIAEVWTWALYGAMCLLAAILAGRFG
jgi:hypothetical protein